MANTPSSPAQTPGTVGNKIWEQSWFKWCEFVVTIWGVLTPLYGAFQYFLKFAPVWDAGDEAPRWFDLLVTYFFFPVMVLGLYASSLALVAMVTGPPRKARPYQIIISIPIAAIAIGYSIWGDDDTRQLLHVWGFLFGIGSLFLVGVGLVLKVISMAVPDRNRRE